MRLIVALYDSKCLFCKSFTDIGGDQFGKNEKRDCCSILLFAYNKSLERNLRLHYR
jgi:hypothetical protein